MVPVLTWLSANWFPLIQSLGIVGAVGLTGLALVMDVKVRRVSNLIRLTEQHRELWERLYARPELVRVLDPRADVVRSPVTSEEELFVVLAILHLSTSFYAMKTGYFRRPDGLAADVRSFFDLPVPSAVWDRVKSLQDVSFVRFVESCREESGDSSD